MEVLFLWGIQINLFAQGNYYAIARAFTRMKENGMDVSPGATEFANTYLVEPSLLNNPVAVVFFVTAFLIILYPIWFKK